MKARELTEGLYWYWYAAMEPGEHPMPVRVDFTPGGTRQMWVLGWDIPDDVPDDDAGRWEPLPFPKEAS